MPDFKTKAVNGSKTLNATDIDSILEINGSGAINITIPSDSAGPIPPGSTVVLSQIGTGTITVRPGTGVTLQSFNALRKIAGQFAEAYLVKRSNNLWKLTGNLK